jgi:hypothetical protein
MSLSAEIVRSDDTIDVLRLWGRKTQQQIRVVTTSEKTPVSLSPVAHVAVHHDVEANPTFHMMRQYRGRGSYPAQSPVKVIQSCKEPLNDMVPIDQVA